MTRLTSTDISDISSMLALRDKELTRLTGRGLLGVACHAYGVEEALMQHLISEKRLTVIPVTTGEGVISGFSATVAAILSFIGFDVTVSQTPDVAGLAAAFQAQAHAVFMADDNCYAAFHLAGNRVATNDVATGRAFAAGLDLMAGGAEGKQALVLGCGPVGSNGAEALLDFGFDLAIFDTCREAAERLSGKLNPAEGARVEVVTDLPAALAAIPYIYEATPSTGSIPTRYLTAEKSIAAPGVPLFITGTRHDAVPSRIIHDKLELGTVAMAVGMFMETNKENK